MTRQDERRQKAYSMAAARGKAAIEWFKTNKLTPETHIEFNSLMKATDREWKKQNEHKPQK